MIDKNKLIDILVELCIEKITDSNSDYDALKEKFIDHFAFIRLDSKNTINKLLTDLASKESIGIDEAVQQCKQIGSSIIESFLKDQNPPGEEMHWSVKFILKDYQKKIIKRFLYLEKYSDIKWLEKHINHEKEMLELLYQLPAQFKNISASLMMLMTNGSQQDMEKEGATPLCQDSCRLYL